MRKLVQYSWSSVLRICFVPGVPLYSGAILILNKDIARNQKRKVICYRKPIATVETYP
jgi:hypothetical protein